MRFTTKAAGYMELRGAQKDSDCKKVAVDGGVSSKLGCCNYYEPEKRSAQEFRCGMCEYMIAGKRGKFFG